jgi:hypothetical protein
MKKQKLYNIDSIIGLLIALVWVILLWWILPRVVVAPPMKVMAR